MFVRGHPKSIEGKRPEIPIPYNDQMAWLRDFVCG